MNITTKIIIAAIVFSTAGASYAQNLVMMRSGEVRLPEGGREYSVPSTTVVVDVTVRREEIKIGPYARFAQKYFGAIAPLADKTIYTVTGARIGSYDNSTDPEPSVPGLPAARGASVSSHISSDTDFLKVMPDKMSMASRSPEDAARDAAQSIFDIRKRRMELVSGEYAETVFGAGLAAAVERLDKTENQYLELFYGKHIISEETVRYAVVPVAGQSVYVVCRWSENGGLLSSADLTGQPVILELKPEGRAQEVYASDSARKKQVKGGVAYKVADNVACRIVEGKRELASRTLPIFQFGVEATLPE